jgi:hypothetical protein
LPRCCCCCCCSCPSTMKDIRWQRHCGHCHCDRSIVCRVCCVCVCCVCVCVCVCVWTCVCVDVGRGRFIPCILIEKVSECQLEVRIKGVTYLFDYFD